MRKALRFREGRNRWGLEGQRRAFFFFFGSDAAFAGM